MANKWIIPPKHRYCALCHFNVHESMWEGHMKKHEYRGEVVDGRVTSEALDKALYRNNDPQEVKQYRKELGAIQ